MGIEELGEDGMLSVSNLRDGDFIIHVISISFHQQELHLGRVGKGHGVFSVAVVHLSGKELRCTNKKDNDKKVEGSNDLSSLSDERLVELQKKVTEEMEKRLKKR